MGAWATIRKTLDEHKFETAELVTNSDGNIVRDVESFPVYLLVCRCGTTVTFGDQRSSEFTHLTNEIDKALRENGTY